MRARPRLQNSLGSGVIIGDQGVDIFQAVAGDGNDIYVGHDTVNGSQEYNQIDYLGAESVMENFTFLDNGDGSIRVSSDAYGEDLLWGVDGIWFEAENQWVSTEALFA